MGLMTRLCGCGQPESCVCARKGSRKVMWGPFDFAKLHGCVPTSCLCKGADSGELKQAFDATVYLSPMVKAVRKMTGVSIRLVKENRIFLYGFANDGIVFQARQETIERLPTRRSNEEDHGEKVWAFELVLFSALLSTTAFRRKSYYFQPNGLRREVPGHWGGSLCASGIEFSPLRPNCNYHHPPTLPTKIPPAHEFPPHWPYNLTSRVLSNIESTDI